MTSDQLKTGLMLAAIALGGLVAVRVYNRASVLGSTVAKAGDIVSNVPAMVSQAVSDTVTDTINTVKSSLGMEVDNGWTMPADYGARELPFSQWSSNAQATINALNKTRGIKREWKYAGDFTGWKVFSDGTMISPDGFYFSSRTNVLASQSPDFAQDGNLLVNVDQVFAPLGKDFDQTRYQWQEQ